MTEFFLYTCRHGDDVILIEKSRKSWDYLLEMMEHCNGGTLEQFAADGFDIEGSYEEGRFYMDDGGTIDTIRLTVLP